MQRIEMGWEEKVKLVEEAGREEVDRIR